MRVILQITEVRLFEKFVVVEYEPFTKAQIGLESHLLNSAYLSVLTTALYRINGKLNWLGVELSLVIVQIEIKLQKPGSCT